MKSRKTDGFDWFMMFVHLGSLLLDLLKLFHILK